MRKRCLINVLCTIVMSAFMITAVMVPAYAGFPKKAIKLIVPWSPGGSGDMTCRILAAHMEKVLGKPVVVKNMPGAGSMVGATALVNSRPDGYTLGFLGISAAIGQYTSVSPVMMNEYRAVSGIINPSLVLLVNAKTPWKTLEAFVSFAGTNPGRIKNGNAGAGVIDHLYSSEFATVAGITFTQVPYKGWGPSLAALAGGHIDSMFVPMGPAKAMVDAGKIRPLAIAADVRHPSFSDIPTMKEGGLDITMPFWESIVVPAQTPDDVVAVLDNAVRKAFEDPGTMKKIKNSGLDVSYLGTPETAQLRAASDSNVRSMVEALGLRQN